MCPAPHLIINTSPISFLISVYHCDSNSLLGTKNQRWMTSIYMIPNSRYGRYSFPAPGSMFQDTSFSSFLPIVSKPSVGVALKFWTFLFGLGFGLNIGFNSSKLFLAYPNKNSLATSGKSKTPKALTLPNHRSSTYCRVLLQRSLSAAFHDGKTLILSKFPLPENAFELSLADPGKA